MRSPVEKSSLRTVTLYEFLIAHWLERLTGTWKVVGSIPAGGIDRIRESNSCNRVMIALPLTKFDVFLSVFDNVDEFCVQ